jgi:hypothetical protein
VINVLIASRIFRDVRFTPKADFAERRSLCVDTVAKVA